MRDRIPRGKQNVLEAERVVDVSKYENLHKDAMPLVASVDYLAQKYHLENAAVLEVGPVPTQHYRPKHFSFGTGLSVQAGSEYVPGEIHERDIPPIRYLAERHPTWRFAAVSPHDISDETREKLFGPRKDIFVHALGPKRKLGLDPEDVWDEQYKKGQSIIRHYPELRRRLGNKQPDIILGRHVFDASAKDYPVGKLTIVAAMLLRPGGFLVSHVYGSDMERSRVPLDKSNNFPFDTSKNLKQVFTLRFPKNDNGEEDYVHVFQKKADVIHPDYK